MRLSFCLASLPSCQNSSSLDCLLHTPEVREFEVDGTNVCATDLLFNAFFPDQDFSSNSNLEIKIITLDLPCWGNFLPF